ncbi:acyl-CoA dehydrogenase [Erythrobacter arachoides]|uniref:Acyl-CoA dehydrogenase n=1 Tax=Aurantiacibacter arachoides TaxID=1850444 RepID=A0A845A982_9SPHN|nr:acyl-CoA dehydrogenase family protein [Aurantiacibacter arachoides]MXO94129.1 acyl-CoA dehydrogenase [Aurantiacibacter arachoides]GGD65836.1 isovaleryl-CoA dehydrogenase [Aurantiacibacter arachoides]
MPLFLDPEQEMLADTVRPFIAETAPVAHLRSLRDAGEPAGFSREVWQGFAEMGFTGVLVDEAHGGLGLGHVEAGIVLEEIGRNLTPSPFLGTAVGAVEALRQADEAMQVAWLPGIVRGEVVAGLALDESARHRPERVALKAERHGNTFRLSGAKQFVPFGHEADLLIVSARTSGSEADEEGVTLFALPRTQAGVTVSAQRLADSSMAARVALDGVELDGSAVIGEVDGGRAVLDRVLSCVRAGAASEMQGVAEGASAMTLDYLKQRRQFGRVIGSYQALQHRAAHLYSELEVARAATLKAQQSLDAGSDTADREASVAKAMAGMASGLAVREAVQMHGGIGMTDEYDIGFFMKRQRVLAEMFGDTDYHADRLARMEGY